MNKTMWIAKSNGYCLLDREPTREEYNIHEWRGGTTWHNELEYFCADVFEPLTGIKLEKPGQFCQIEVKQIGEVWEFTE